MAEIEYDYVNGFLALERADLEGVRDAIHLLRGAENPSEDSALSLEAYELTAQDRLPEARETLERLRILREMNGATGPEALDARADLCNLACDEGRRSEVLDCLSRFSSPPAEINVFWSVDVGLMIAKCRYLAGDIKGGGNAGSNVLVEAQRYGWYRERVLANIYLMRARAALGDHAKAIPSLRADLSEAATKGAKSVAFEVALALGEVEMRAGRPEERIRLLNLEQEAQSRGFFRVARLAREARDWQPLRRPGEVDPRLR